MHAMDEVQAIAYLDCIYVTISVYCVSQQFHGTSDADKDEEEYTESFRHVQ